MPWPRQTRFDPVGTMATTANAMQNLEGIARRRRFEEAMMAQQPGQPVPQAAMAAMPQQAAQVSQAQLTQQAAQRKQEFLQAIGPASVAVQQGQDYNSLIPPGLGEQYPELMSEWQGQAMDSLLKVTSTRASVAADKITRRYRIADTLRDVGSAEGWDRAINHLVEIGFPGAAQYLGKYSPSIRDQMVSDAEREISWLTKKMGDDLATLSPYGKFREDQLRIAEGYGQAPPSEKKLRSMWLEEKRAGAIKIGADEKPGIGLMPSTDYANLLKLTEVAQGGIEQLYAINELEGLMGEDLYMGAGADVMLFANKVFKMLGFDVDKIKIENTEAARAQLIRLALPMLKNFPGQLSEKEMEAAFQTIGTTAEEPGALKAIMAAVTRSAKRDIKRQKDDVAFYQENFNVQPSFILDVPEFDGRGPARTSVGGLRAIDYRDGQTMEHEGIGYVVRKGLWETQ